MPVDTYHPQYTEAAPTWKKIRDFYAGATEVKEAGEEYLPRLGGMKLGEEGYDDYENIYKFRATLYNATRRTVIGMLGAIHRKESEVEFPENLKDLLDDITLTGVNLEDFARVITADMLKPGRFGVLVDYPEDQPPPEPGEEALQEPTYGRNKPEKRPFMVGYTAEQIINWRTVNINGVQVLTRVTLQEAHSYDDPDDPFNLLEETRYRVLILDPVTGQYRQEIHEQGNDDNKSYQVTKTIVPLKFGQPLSYIPFRIFPEIDITPSPIEDLVEMNHGHYLTMADLEWGRHFCGIPTPIAAGFDNQSSELPLGAAMTWVSSNADAKAYWMEFSGAGLKELVTARQEKEAHMQALGARLLEEQAGTQETASAVRMRHSGDQSALAGIVNSVSSGLTVCLQWFAEWAGSSEPASIDINTDFFDEPMVPQLLGEIVKTWQAGGCSRSTVVYNMKQGDLLPMGRTVEEEEKLIDAEGQGGTDLVSAEIGLPPPLNPAMGPAHFGPQGDQGNLFPDQQVGA